MSHPSASYWFLCWFCRKFWHNKMGIKSRPSISTAIYYKCGSADVNASCSGCHQCENVDKPSRSFKAPLCVPRQEIRHKQYPKLSLEWQKELYWLYKLYLVLKISRNWIFKWLARLCRLLYKIYANHYIYNLCVNANALYHISAFYISQRINSTYRSETFTNWYRCLQRFYELSIFGKSINQTATAPPGHIYQR